MGLDVATLKAPIAGRIETAVKQLPAEAETSRASQPVRPSSIRSTAPSTGVATTGTPQAIASRTT